jgi:hypothetical protein
VFPVLLDGENWSMGQAACCAGRQRPRPSFEHPVRVCRGYNLLDFQDDTILTFDEGKSRHVRIFSAMRNSESILGKIEILDRLSNHGQHSPGFNTSSVI